MHEPTTKTLLFDNNSFIFTQHMSNHHHLDHQCHNMNGFESIHSIVILYAKSLILKAKSPNRQRVIAPLVCLASSGVLRLRRGYASGAFGALASQRGFGSGAPRLAKPDLCSIHPITVWVRMIVFLIIFSNFFPVGSCI